MAPLINFSGLASGIDSNALIQATSDATRKQRVTPKQNKIDELEAQDKSLEELKTKFLALQTSLKSMGSLAGGALAKTASVSDEAVLSATAANSALNGSYSVTVNALAKSATYSFPDRPTDPSAVINAGAAGNVVFTVGNGTYQEVVTVPVGATTTWSSFVTAFNDASNRAEASLVNVGTTTSPQYALVVTTNDTGLEKGQIVSVTVDPSIGPAMDTGTATHSAATDASVSVSGIGGNITRSTNSISDIIPGLTLNLASTGGPVTINVKADPETTTTTVKKFVDSYNEIITYLAENNVITRQENGQNVTNVFSPLAGTRTDESAMQAFRDAFSLAKYAAGSTVKILADLGVTTERDGTLKFDDAKFKSALATEPVSVNEVLKNLSDTTAVTGGTIDILIRFNGTFDSSLNSNKSLIQSLNDQIAQAEDAITKQEESMRAKFARLEAVIGRLQSQQSSLTSALAGLGR